MLANTPVLAPLLPCSPKNPFITKFCDLKGVLFCVGFGEAEHIRRVPMCDNEPKDTEKSPFQAGSGLNALALRGGCRQRINDLRKIAV